MARRLAAGFIACLLLAGCSGASSDTTGSDLSLTKGYSSLQQLAGDSALVVVGVVVGEPILESSDRDGVTGEMVPVYNVEVKRVLRGGSAPGSLRIRGFGFDPADGCPVLTAGPTYTLFLTPFLWEVGGASTGEYVIVGQQGAFEDKGSKQARVGNLGELPASVSFNEIAAAATAK